MTYEPTVLYVFDSFLNHFQDHTTVVVMINPINSTIYTRNAKDSRPAALYNWENTHVSRVWPFNGLSGFKPSTPLLITIAKMSLWEDQFIGCIACGTILFVYNCRLYHRKPKRAYTGFSCILLNLCCFHVSMAGSAMAVLSFLYGVQWRLQKLSPCNISNSQQNCSLLVCFIVIIYWIITSWHEIVTSNSEFEQ